MRCRHAMPFGAQLRDGGGAVFRLWAPAASQAQLLFYPSAGGHAQPHPAEADKDGWWTCEVDEATAGSMYEWLIDGKLRVPDPASRHNPRGVHAPSSVVDPLQFAWDDRFDAGWKGRPWHEAVLYELHVGAFTPEGTFIAASERLHELADIGITAIELMPVADFPGRFGWGYDGVLPFAPHANYGTPDELKHFVQQAHRLGLMVLLDVVYNHFGPDGNFLAQYAPQFFSKTHKSPWGAAINFDGEGSRTVRDFFIHNALYWIEEFRVDGLRLDAVHAIQDAGTPHFLEELSAAVRSAAQGRHVHLVLENEHKDFHRLSPRPEPGRYDAQWNDDFHHALHVALTGESHGYYKPFAKAPLDLLAATLSDGSFPSHVHFAHNHDQIGNRAFGERLASLVPPEAAPLVTLLALLTPATPLLFFGEEFDAREPFLYFADWDGELAQAVRRGRRKEFPLPPSETRTLPDACSEATFEASRPDAARRTSAAGRERLALVRAALAARAKWITPRQPMLMPATHSAQRVGATGIGVQWRYSDGNILCLELNLGADPVDAPQQRIGAVEAQAVFQYPAVMPDLIRHPATAPEQRPDWIADQVRNDTSEAVAPPDVMPDSIRHPATAPEQRPDWIADQVRNDNLHPSRDILPPWSARWTFGQEITQ